LASSQANRGERLTQQGLKSISPATGTEGMALAMEQDRPQISVMAIDVKKWCTAQPAAGRSSLFKELVRYSAPEPGRKIDW
jgi:hypothetical protein